MAEQLAHLLCCAAGAGTILACAFTRGWLQRLLAIASKFGVAMSYNLVYLWTQEMFPTTVRNTALVITNLLIASAIGRCVVVCLKPSFRKGVTHAQRYIDFIVL